GPCVWWACLSPGRSFPFGRFRRLAFEGIESLLQLGDPCDKRVDCTQPGGDVVELVAEVVAGADGEAVREIDELAERVLAGVGQSRDRVTFLLLRSRHDRDD